MALDRGPSTMLTRRMTLEKNSAAIGRALIDVFPPNPAVERDANINPCGYPRLCVTQVCELGITVSKNELQAQCKIWFKRCSNTHCNSSNKWGLMHFNCHQPHYLPCCTFVYRDELFYSEWATSRVLFDSPTLSSPVTDTSSACPFFMISLMRLALSLSDV